jgi:hypothetical protein
LGCGASNPVALIDLIGALTGDLDANDRLARVHDRTDNVFDRLGQTRHAFPNRASEMILDGDAAYFSQTLVDLQIAAVGRPRQTPDHYELQPGSDSPKKTIAAISIKFASLDSEKILMDLKAKARLAVSRLKSPSVR